nr:DUF2336 domain-containing protein [Gellertiella hungarica]
MRKKDVVLLATVTSFEALALPSKTDLKQFAELFPPLFLASTDEARRQAAAALSRCAHVPDAVALFLGRQPIEIAAVFLTCVPVISDAVLVEIASREGEPHARAIARRDHLSPAVIDALVGLRFERQQKRREPSQTAAIRPQEPTILQPSQQFGLTEDTERMQEEYRMETEETAPESAISMNPASEAAPTAEADRLAREEKLRQDIKALARHLNPPENDRQGLRHIQPVEMALFARFAKAGEIGLFTTALSYALSSTRWLAERILLDMSGLQLATTLVSLGMPDEEAAEVLTGIYPHLAVREGHGTKAEILLESLDQRDCDLRVDSWLRADTYSFPAAGSGKAEDAKFRRFRR